MGRPSRHDTDTLLDAALRLAATDGPAAVTMSAVAAAAGAPSGSLYHRFPSRAALQAALWLRTVERFQRGWIEALAGDARTAGVDAARHVVAWSRANHDEALVLLYGARDFGRDDWPPEERERAEQLRDEGAAAVADLARRLGLRGATGRDRAGFATVDIPYAAVRRHLRAGERVPRTTERLVERAVAAVLARDGEAPRGAPGRRGA
jgi:AcrR family transcriptional regulator